MPSMVKTVRVYDPGKARKVITGTYCDGLYKRKVDSSNHKFFKKGGGYAFQRELMIALDKRNAKGVEVYDKNDNKYYHITLGDLKKNKHPDILDEGHGEQVLVNKVHFKNGEWRNHYAMSKT